MKVEDIIMRINYDKLWHILDDRKMKKTDLIRESGITSNTMARMGKGEEVRIGTLLKIGKTLGCKVDDMVEIAPED